MGSLVKAYNTPLDFVPGRDAREVSYELKKTET
jgi:hypothetical protein